VRAAETDFLVTPKIVAEEMEESGKDGTREKYEINERVGNNERAAMDAGTEDGIKERNGPQHQLENLVSGVKLR